MKSARQVEREAIERAMFPESKADFYVTTYEKTLSGGARVVRTDRIVRVKESVADGTETRYTKDGRSYYIHTTGDTIYDGQFIETLTHRTPEPPPAHFEGSFITRGQGY